MNVRESYSRALDQGTLVRKGQDGTGRDKRLAKFMQNVVFEETATAVRRLLRAACLGLDKVGRVV